ncbi:HypC/HybG/HupF family hydrogenase formation chaperone [Streptomyces sp. SID8379]|nr:HypC/HybG/HupF family hydrogenase formation chaperone [Streptomyces sp. SID8379]MYW67773.1 HypC/HybG/HupF family hydrogenase formation chaperone [Streptomyces sp. SID8379]
MCVGIPGRVLEAHDEAGLRMATVDFGGIRHEVCLAYSTDGDEGTYVMVHVGFAITTIDEPEARLTLAGLRCTADAVEGELGQRLPTGPDGGEPGAGRPGSRALPATGGPSASAGRWKRRLTAASVH